MLMRTHTRAHARRAFSLSTSGRHAPSELKESSSLWSDDYANAIAKAGVPAVYKHMARFIRVVDQVTEAHFCEELIQRFDASPHRVPGRLGTGIDLTKKNSTDLAISAYPEWQAALREVFALVRPHLFEYARHFSSLVLGALSPDVMDPISGHRMTLSVDNLEAAGKGLLGPLVQRCYRMDTVNLQKYERNSGNFRHWHSEIYPEKDTQRALHRVLFLDSLPE